MSARNSPQAKADRRALRQPATQADTARRQLRRRVHHGASIIVWLTWWPTGTFGYLPPLPEAVVTPMPPSVRARRRATARDLRRRAG